MQLPSVSMLALMRSPFDQWRCANTPTRLRVGLVSGDLREHPVGYFLENVIANTDVARVEWLAYSTVAQSDELTARLQTHVTKWTMLAGMSYEDSARCIHADGRAYSDRPIRPY